MTFARPSQALGYVLVSWRLAGGARKGKTTDFFRLLCTKEFPVGEPNGLLTHGFSAERRTVWMTREQANQWGEEVGLQRTDHLFNAGGSCKSKFRAFAERTGTWQKRYAKLGTIITTKDEVALGAADMKLADVIFDGWIVVTAINRVISLTITDATGRSGLHREESVEALPVEKTIGLMQLLNTSIDERLTKEPEFPHDVVRAICTRFFQQRTGEFANDVEQLQRAERLHRSGATFELHNIPHEREFLLDDGPGGVLEEFIAWILDDAQTLTEHSRAHFISGALSVYLKHRWFERGSDLIVRVGARPLDTNVWRMLWRLVRKLPDRARGNRYFRAVGRQLLAQSTNLPDRITDAASAFALGPDYFLMGEIALLCQHLHLSEGVREALRWILSKVTDEELRSLRPIIPPDMVTLAAKYPNRQIPADWLSTSRVLVIEESMPTLTAFNAILERLGHTVTLVRSVAEGIERLTEQPQVIVVSDVLYGTTGIDLIMHLREHEPSMFPRVVLLTTHPQIRNAFLGRIPLLSRPFIPEDLVATMRELPSGSGEFPDDVTLERMQKLAQRLASTYQQLA